MATIDLSKLTTERRNPDTMELDTFSPLEIATTMNNEDLNVVAGVKEVLPEIAKAIEWCAEALKNGGRIIYMGAGTSGRLGLLDAVECPPTFGVPHEKVVGLLAGGENGREVVVGEQHLLDMISSVVNPAPIVVNVYGAEGQDEELLAQKVMEKIQEITNSKEVVYA